MMQIWARGHKEEVSGGRELRREQGKAGVSVTGWVSSRAPLCGGEIWGMGNAKRKQNRSWRLSLAQQEEPQEREPEGLLERESRVVGWGAGGRGGSPAGAGMGDCRGGGGPSYASYEALNCGP